MRRAGATWAMARSIATLPGAMLLLALSAAAATNAGRPDDIPPLRPARGEIPPGFFEQYGGWVIAGGIVLVAAIAALAWWIFRPKPVPPESPYAAAIRELQSLANTPEDGLVLSRVSQILRRYLGASFSLGEGERTTAEMAAALAAEPRLGASLKQEMMTFLKACDQRKFAPGPAAAPLGAVPEALRLVEAAELSHATAAQAVRGQPEPHPVSGT